MIAKVPVTLFVFIVLLSICSSEEVKKETELGEEKNLLETEHIIKNENLVTTDRRRKVKEGIGKKCAILNKRGKEVGSIRGKVYWKCVCRRFKKHKFVLKSLKGRGKLKLKLSGGKIVCGRYYPERVCGCRRRRYDHY